MVVLTAVSVNSSILEQSGLSSHLPYDVQSVACAI